MKRTTTIVLALCLIALVAVATGYSFRSAPQQANRTAALQDHRGGTLKLWRKAAGGTLDPQVNYTLEYWQLFQATYDGLLAFKKAGGSDAFNGRARPRLEPPTPTNGGKTWVFKLRKGIKFSNGKTVTVERRRRVVPAHLQGEEPDRRAASTRASSARQPASRSRPPARSRAAWSRNDEDEHGDVQPRRARLGIQVPARRAASRASSRRTRPPKDVGTKPLPGTGAYYFTSYDPNKQLVMKRNPYFKEWSHDAQPDGYPDEIIQSFGLTVEAQITAVENGQADWIVRERTGRPPRRDRHEVREPGARQPADGVLVRADERQHPAVQQPEGAPGGELRDRPQRGRQDLRRPEARVAVLPGPAARLPGPQPTTARTPRTRARSGPRRTSPRPRQLVKESGTAGPEGHGRLVGRRREQGDGHLPPERAQLDRLQGHRQADLR